VFQLGRTLLTQCCPLSRCRGRPDRADGPYRGHVFWDELFVLPLITTRLPAVAKALLDYRWRRLDAARYAAQQAGLVGALFPWQSGSDGREETLTELFNLRSRRWMPDNSRRQRHAGLAIAYNAW
jgi:trehalose/maltose hydrolase-like predicted phosphorylase